MKGNREKTIIRTSVLSIAANILLAGFKASIGLISNSIAIVSDAINNLSDALSSIITIVGTKLAGKAPDKKHPYGYGRIEYMTSFVISAIVLYAGITALVESIKKIVHPEKPDYSIATLVILVGGILVKLVLGIFVKKKGRAVNSDSLVASGSDAFNDAILSASVLVSAVVYMIFKINLEAYVGAILSLFIIKSGLELIKESVDNILGMRVESALSKNIKKDVASEEEVLGAFDLILTNYGPDRYLGSIHIEVRDTLSVSELDKVSRKITRKILEKYGVVLHTVGIYSVNTKDSSVVAMRDEIRDIVFSHDGILQMHGFYASEEEKTISFDIIIDFKIKNREEVWQKICTEVQSRYADYNVTIALDVDASD